MNSTATSFKFRGYSGKRSGMAASLLFLDDDEDDDKIYDLDDSVATGSEVLGGIDSTRKSSDRNFDKSPNHYDNPAELCRLQDAEEMVVSPTALNTSNLHMDGDINDGESSLCFDVPDAAMPSCIWAGSSLLSRMLFQIYNEMGDESQINTW